MNSLFDSHVLAEWLPSIVTLGICIFGLWLIHYLLLGRNTHLGNERRVPRQMMMFALTLISIIVFIISLPINAELRNQVIGLIGIVLSGLIAFSSTNLIGNLMAGILLRITKPFGIGDFVRVGDFFGRVSERGLFDTEIQSENRELISLPNSFLANNPVTTIHHSGAIVSATLSLGYDVHNKKIEPLLLEAAEQSGLSDAFVHIIELNDFSVSYRVSGFLSEVKGLITARSTLLRAVLDTLHGHGVEIMSPTFMNQRRLEQESTTIPGMHFSKAYEERIEAEQIVFDKAEKAQQKADKKKRLYEEIATLESEIREVEGEQQEPLKQALSERKEQLTALQSKEPEDESAAQDSTADESAQTPKNESKG